MISKKPKKIVMGQTLLNRLALSLRAFCEAHSLEEKWLIAPSRRVGFQWLDGEVAAERLGKLLDQRHEEAIERLCSLEYRSDLIE